MTIGSCLSLRFNRHEAPTLAQVNFYRRVGTGPLLSTQGSQQDDVLRQNLMLLPSQARLYLTSNSSSQTVNLGISLLRRGLIEPRLRYPHTH
ncbi:hypothetical protein PM082_019592 [Marasmius tenuissimus]|nr:hypothetical protein PM082_019592 [Marasmius tenuissimus]